MNHLIALGMLVAHFVLNTHSATNTKLENHLILSKSKTSVLVKGLVAFRLSEETSRRYCIVVNKTLNKVRTNSTHLEPK